ncbi:cmk-1, partial [Symbiodinium microadriaticum]
MYVVVKLGKGAFSEVRSGVHISSGMPVAIKCLALAKLSKKDEKDVAMEIELLREVQHPHVVKLFDDYRDKHFIYMVLEVIQGGELFDWIVSREYFLEEEARDLMYTLLQTIAHLHYRHIVHRDIKPENILMVDKTANSSVKLTDFGFAARCPNDHCLREACGSPSYVAPEVLKRVPYGRPADVWSLGVVGYILLCGYTPFDASSDKEMFELTKRGQYQFHSDAWDMISDEAKDLISHLLVVNPESRFTARQALDHPWFARAGLKTRSLDITLVNLKKFQALKKFRVAGKA